MFKNIFKIFTLSTLLFTANVQAQIMSPLAGGDATQSNIELGAAEATFDIEASNVTTLTWWGSYDDAGFSVQLSGGNNSNYSFNDITGITPVDSGFKDVSNETIYRYDFTFATPIALTGGNYSLSIASKSDTTDWYWSHADAGNLAFALNVSPVPEAEEWAMMLLGLPIVGWVTRRRKAGSN